MTAPTPNLNTRTTLAWRRFNAWWEGYAFDEALERANLADARRRTLSPQTEIPRLIWGAGRDEPGDPAWTMRHARALGLAAKAHVVIFGAGGGAPLRDLKSGSRWTVSGLARSAVQTRGLDLRSYDDAMAHLDRRTCDGAITLFELHRDGDPGAFARFAGEFLKPGAPVAFVDFALVRQDGRLRSGFDGILSGAPRLAADYVRILKDAGLAVSDTTDETRLYMPLVARGWTSWRRAYEAAKARPDAPARAQALQYLSNYAALWADRFDAMKEGRLQVVRILARRNG